MSNRFKILRTCFVGGSLYIEGTVRTIPDGVDTHPDFFQPLDGKENIEKLVDLTETINNEVTPPPAPAGEEIFPVEPPKPKIKRKKKKRKRIKQI